MLRRIGLTGSFNMLSEKKNPTFLRRARVCARVVYACVRVLCVFVHERSSVVVLCPALVVVYCRPSLLRYLVWFCYKMGLERDLYFL